MAVIGVGGGLELHRRGGGIRSPAARAEGVGRFRTAHVRNRPNPLSATPREDSKAASGGIRALSIPGVRASTSRAWRLRGRYPRLRRHERSGGPSVVRSPAASNCRARRRRAEAPAARSRQAERRRPRGPGQGRTLHPPPNPPLGDAVQPAATLTGTPPTPPLPPAHHPSRHRPGPTGPTRTDPTPNRPPSRDTPH